MSNLNLMAMVIGLSIAAATLPPIAAMVWYLLRGGRRTFLIGAVWAAVALGIYLQVLLT